MNYTTVKTIPCTPTIHTVIICMHDHDDLEKETPQVLWVPERLSEMKQASPTHLKLP